MAMLMTKAQAEKWLDNSEGKQYNPDLSYGFQCYDYANAFLWPLQAKGYMVCTQRYSI